MKRKVQVWQLTDALRNPLAQRVPAKSLYDLLAAQQAQGVDMRFFHSDGMETLMEAVAGTPRPHLCLHRVRRDNLPAEVDPTGQIHDLSIPNANGLVEATNFVFYPRNVVVAVYNHEGPRVRRFVEWMNGRLGTDLDVRPVYRADVLAIIDSLVRVSSIELAIPAEMTGSLESDEDDVAGALGATANLTDGGTTHVTLGVGHRRPPSARQRLGAVARRIARRNDLPLFTTARVTGVLEGDREPTVVDLVHDQLVAQREVDPISVRDRRISHESALTACDDTYHQYKQQIEATVSPIPASNMPLPSTLATVVVPAPPTPGPGATTTT